MDDKTWGTTKTGTVFHSFKADGTAICRGSIRQPEGVDSYTETQVDARLAEAWGARVRGFRKCETCAGKEAAFRDRAEAAMAPATGEGDYLPPAETKCCEHAPMYHGARGCDECGCNAPRNARRTVPVSETYNEQEISDVDHSRRKMTGPLSDRQRDILHRLVAGETQREIASAYGLSESYVSQERCLAVRKLGSRTTAAAVARYRSYLAYREAADMIEGGRIPVPLVESDAHVNHVLEGVAKAVRERAERLLPQ
jgi:DNA-binding CsgD family transcriptional regulator